MPGAYDESALPGLGELFAMGLTRPVADPIGTSEDIIQPMAPLGPMPPTRSTLTKLKNKGDKEQPKLTKKERETEDKRARLSEVINRRGMTPGENRMPLVNPSDEELATIRAQHGPSPITDVNLFAGSKDKPPYVSTEGVKQLLPPSQPRSREQRYLQRQPMPEKGLHARTQQMITDPNVRTRIREAAEQGRGVQDWYDTTSLQKAFTDEFGDDEGMRRFSDFIGMVASTSTGNKIGPNIKMASNYFAQKYGGGRDFATDPMIRSRYDQKPLDLPSWEVPPEGYGHDKQLAHMSGVNELSRFGGIEGIDNPKTQAFYENLMGNWMPTTLDKHATRLSAMATRDPRWLSEQGQKAHAEMTAAGLDENAMIDQLLGTATNWTDAPEFAGEYPAMEKMWDDIAKEMGVSPAELQAMAWVGGGKQTGLGSPPVTFMDAFMDRIRRTSVRDNIPPDQVLKLMLHGKMTLAQLEPGAGQDAGGGGTMIG